MPAQKPPLLLLLSGLTVAALPRQMGSLSLAAWQRQAMQSGSQKVPPSARACAKDLMLVLLLPLEGDLAKQEAHAVSEGDVPALHPLHGKFQGAGYVLRMHLCIWLLQHLRLTKFKSASNATGCNYMSMSHTSADLDETAAGKSYCGAFVAAPEQYCARTVNLQSFSEVNR